MDILELLKQFKKIEPNRARAEESKFLILNTRPLPQNGWLAAWRTALNVLEVGSATALAGLVLILIFGGFGIFQSFSPVRLSGLDKAGLKAEAEAIDIQIQLANLNYSETPATSANSTQAVATAVKKAAAEKPAAAAETISGAENADAAEAPLSELSVDEALGELAE